MGRVLAAAATVAALASALPASATVTNFGGRTHLTVNAVSSVGGVVVGGSGLDGEVGFGGAPVQHIYGPTGGSGSSFGPNGELLGSEADLSSLSVSTFTSDGSISRSVATSTAALVSNRPEISTYVHFDYEIELSYILNAGSFLYLEYQNADFVSLTGDGVTLFSLDLSGQTGSLTFDLLPNVGYGLLFSGNSGHLVSLDGVGSVSATDTSTYVARIGSTPEPSTWALMIMGFGGVGAAMRRRPARGLIG